MAAFESLDKVDYHRDIEQKELDEILELNAQSRSKMLDLSRKKISSFPDKIYFLEHLQYIYLEGNKIEVIPTMFSASLLQLVWLDLRNNYLTALPENISMLCQLKNLLLENNKLQSLPLQLGFLTCLTGLNLSNNPLVFPPKHVIETGVKGVLKFLRDQTCHQEKFERPQLPDKSYKECSLDTKRSLCVPLINCSNQLLHPLSSNIIDIKVCKKYFHSNTKKRDSYSAPVQKTKQSSNRSQKSQFYSVAQREICKISKRNFREFDQGTKNIEESKTSNENMDTLVQKLRTKEVLDVWRSKAKQKQQEVPTLNSTSFTINFPYGNDLEGKSLISAAQAKKVKESVQSDEITLRTFQNMQLEQQIHEHVKKMKLFNQNKSALNAKEALKQAEDNLNEALNLQKELEKNHVLEYRLKAFFT